MYRVYRLSAGPCREFHFEVIDFNVIKPIQSYLGMCIGSRSTGVYICIMKTQLRPNNSDIE